MAEQSLQRRTASGAIVGRPRKPPPAHVVPVHRETLPSYSAPEIAESAPDDAAELIELLAADGWSKVGIAWKLGTKLDVLNRWFEEAPALLEAFEVGRERERQTLHNRLYRIATESKDEKTAILAAQTLLNSKHGYRRDVTDEPGRKTGFFLTLQAPMSAEEYRKAIEHTVVAVMAAGEQR